MCDPTRAIPTQPQGQRRGFYEYKRSLKDNHDKSCSYECPAKKYDRKFGLRLDDETSCKLERLTQTFHRSAAEVIRQLVAQARYEDFPRSWQLALEERRPPDARPTKRTTL